VIEEIRIHDLGPDHPLLMPYRTLRTPDLVNRIRQFVIQGDKSIIRLLSSPCRTVSVLCSPRFLERIRPWLADRAEPVSVILGETEEIRKVIGYRMYQEVMAVAGIPESPPLESVLMTAPAPWLFVAVDGISNAENLGTLIRNCSGFGVTALLCGETSCSPWLRRSVRCTMGTIFNLPIVEPRSLAAALQTLRQNGVRIIGSFPHERQRKLSDAPLKDSCCLIFGAEGDGVSPGVAALCDLSVTIPMHHGTDSLNVASASSAFLYETNRQRGLA
jgi:tRNA G18 (ribose-2'-O)-methylase SpoU